MGTMKYLILIVGVIYLISRFVPTKGIKQITTSELKGELKNKNNQFIDVRTTGEFKQISIKSFKNIPLNELSNKAQVLDKERSVIVICQSGMRSSNAARLLKKEGFKEIINVKGGMNAWR